MEHVWYMWKKTQIAKLKYWGAMLVDTLLAGICKTANPRGLLFFFLGFDWLNPEEQNEENSFSSANI